MTTRRKTLLVLIAVLSVGNGVYWIANRENENRLKTDIDRLKAEITIPGPILEYPQRLPLFTNGVMSSYHEKGYENSWIQDMDREKGIVLITTINSKRTIVFKPAADDFKKFHVGWIAPVTFKCTKLKKGKCDFNSPFKLFVSNGLVEVKQLKFPEK